MPTIKLSDATYRRLLREAVSFEDTAESVVVRLLDQAGKKSTRRKEILDIGQRARTRARATPGSILPIEAYWLPMLETLAEAGGSAPANEVIEALAERMRDSFTPRDEEQLETGEVRWRNRARFARLRMAQKGLLSNRAPRGVWQITEEGRRYLTAGRKPG